MPSRRRRPIEFSLYSQPPPWLVWRPPARTQGPWRRLLRRPPRAWRTGAARRAVPGPALLGTAAAVLVLLALGLSRHATDTVPPPAAILPASAGVSAPAPASYGSQGGHRAEPFAPARLTIPSIDVDAPVDRVGLRGDGVIEAPERADRAGWFELSAPAGAVGSTVLVGHRDRSDRRALFWDLARLRPGDPVAVAGPDGRALTYVVERVETYPRDAVPMDRLFATDRPRVALVTCAGDFDRRTGDYSHRLVVYAVAAP